MFKKNQIPPWILLFDIEQLEFINLSYTEIFFTLKYIFKEVNSNPTNSEVCKFQYLVLNAF